MAFFNDARLCGPWLNVLRTVVPNSYVEDITYENKLAGAATGINKHIFLFSYFVLNIFRIVWYNLIHSKGEVNIANLLFQYGVEL